MSAVICCYFNAVQDPLLKT